MVPREDANDLIETLMSENIGSWLLLFNSGSVQQISIVSITSCGLSHDSGQFIGDDRVAGALFIDIGNGNDCMQPGRRNVPLVPRALPFLGQLNGRYIIVGMRSEAGLNQGVRNSSLRCTRNKIRCRHAKVFFMYNYCVSRFVKRILKNFEYILVEFSKIKVHFGKTSEFLVHFSRKDRIFSKFE